jgi:hypothetical protein
MKTRLAGLILTGLLLGALAGCNTISVWSEHDPRVSFDDLATYDWATVSQSVQNDPHAENPILDARVRLAVENELTARGFVKQTGAPPDFLVGYHVVIEEKADVRYVDEYYGYSYTYRGRAPRKTVYTYEQGSLFLDVSRPDPKRLIWRSIARTELTPGQSQEKEDQRLAEIVRKMFDKFPAKGPAAAGETG